MSRLLAVLTVLSAMILAGAALAKPLDTGVVIDLLNAGLSEPSIRHYVERNHFTFDLSADDLQALKQAGASDDLIAFLQDREEDQDREQGEGDQSYGQDYGASGEADYGIAYYSPGYAYGFYDFYFPSYSYSAYPYYYYPFYPHHAYYYPYYYPYSRTYYPRYYPYRSNRGEPGLYPRLTRNRSGTGGLRTASPSGSSSGIRSRSTDTRGRSSGIRSAPSSSRPHFSGSRSSGGGSTSGGRGRGRR